MLTAEQITERQHGLGASDAAPAVGLSKWVTRYELYREKVGEPLPERDEAALYLEMGHALEPVALSRFEKRTGFQVSGQQTKVVDPKWPRRWVRVDAFSSDGGYVEAKSTGFADPAEWGNEENEDEVPMAYYIQCQHGLACTGLPWAWMPLIISNRQFRVYRVKRDEETIALMTEKEREFWAMVEARTPPPPADLDDVALRWPTNTLPRVMATEAVALALADHRAAKEQVKAAEEAVRNFELIVKQHMAEASELVDVEGNILCTWKQARPSLVFDKEKFALDQPELYRQYQVEKPGSRRFLNKL